MAIRVAIRVCLFRVCAVGGPCRTAEGGNLDDFILKMDMGQTEPATYETAVAKKFLDLAGSGICGYVEILRGALQKQVTDTSTYQMRDEAPLTEPVERVQGIRTHLLS
jgi:hypothetical protein